MLYKGNSAIAFLKDQVLHDDPASSSHWQFFHKDFCFYEDDTFSGLLGFGGCQLPYKGLRLFLHKILQKKYRAMVSCDPEFDLIDHTAKVITQKQNRAYDLDVLRQTLTLPFLKRHLSFLGNKSAVAVIGDGFASMTCLLLATGLAKYVFLINLNKTLLVDAVYIKKWLGENDFEQKFNLVTDNQSLAQPLNGGEVIATQAIYHELMRFIPLDLVINIASMQEMDPDVIHSYFEDMRAISKNKSLYFYCCNREEKLLPDGKKIQFLNYPWSKSDFILVDELCPWHQQYYVLYPPFYKNYDGPIRHRIVKFS